MFCSDCGNQIADRAVICVKCGVATGKSTPVVSDQKSRTAYILLGVFLGAFGVHNFYTGRTSRAVGQLLISLLTGWLIIPLLAVQVWAIVDVCTINTDSNGALMAYS